MGHKVKITALKGRYAEDDRYSVVFLDSRFHKDIPSEPWYAHPDDLKPVTKLDKVLE